MNDDGSTVLPGGLRMRKSDALFDALGGLDELNAALGLLRSQLSDPADAARVESIQRDLLDIGGEIAGGGPGLPADAVAALERERERRGAELPPLRRFVLPGNNEPSARAHFARAACRRAERDLVRAREAHPDRISLPALAYLNRLSNLLFVWARALDS
ncbi:MAG: cob(I)yrinic acid a,c-diamide adenosyltransferase [Opitutae bacterium]|nr:cob(I)yrinic acid a,c-diamide adenosyltransferase [Opitutae bacterium]